MTARVRLEIQRADGSTDVRQVQPQNGGAVGLAAGTCPGCQAAPFLVKGGDHRRNPNRPHDESIANGRCVDCGDPVGYLYARHDTIFGLEEDQRVTHGRPRCY